MSLKGLVLNSQNGYMGRGHKVSDDDDDDDDEDDDDELFLWYGWPTKGVKSYFQLRPLLEILTMSNLR